MHKVLESVCDSLDGLAQVVLRGWTDDRSLKEVHGWNQPALTRHDLAGIASGLADRIRRANVEEVDESVAKALAEVPRRLQLLHGDTVPNLFNGHGHQAAPAYMAALNWLDRLLEPVLYWRLVTDTKQMPVNIARRLRSVQAELDAIVPEKDSLHEQIRLIGEATEAAESLPADLESLRKARNEVLRISTESASLLGKIDEKNSNAEAALNAIVQSESEASRLIAQCNEAYRITTTTGLAASFDQRAKTLSRSMWVWVVGLLVALITGAIIGAQRVELLTNALGNQNPHWGVIWIHVVLSVLSVGAPLWFAWLATKQVGQRFRLAEDYGFKASVAKAYEGYRREAARIDEAFEARLFSSALSRLEEAPLRLVEETSHGSPWHELIASDAFRSAMEKVPSLRERFLNITKDAARDRPKADVEPD
jgi:hypothetical protein